MKRLLTTGTSIVTPTLAEEELKRALSELGASEAFDDVAIHELFFRIGRIYGSWLSEQESMQVSPVAKALRSAARSLIEVSNILSGHETGLRTHVEVEATSSTARILALDPNIGSLETARTLISSFQKDAARIGHACMVAYADLTQKGTNEGRARLGWYDDFTTLLLDIAHDAGIKPTLGRDRTSGKRTGWLFSAAQALEPFLDPYMRSPSPEACGKRLERSRKRLSR